MPHPKKYWGEEYLILPNFGMLNMKVVLNIENWLWFPSYIRDLIKMSYHSVDEYSARC